MLENFKNRTKALLMHESQKLKDREENKLEMVKNARNELKRKEKQ